MKLENIVKTVGIIALAGFLTSCEPSDLLGNLNDTKNIPKTTNNVSTNRPTYVVPKIEYEISERNIDQVFRDHDGLRIYYTDKNQIVQEMKIYSLIGQNCNHIMRGLCDYSKIHDEKISLEVRTFNPENRSAYGIVRDLKPEENPKIRTVKFSDGHTYFEIHLNKNSKISPGIEIFGNPKHRIYSDMGEIK